MELSTSFNHGEIYHDLSSRLLHQWRWGWFERAAQRWDGLGSGSNISQLVMVKWLGWPGHAAIPPLGPEAGPAKSGWLPCCNCNWVANALIVTVHSEHGDPLKILDTPRPPQKSRPGSVEEQGLLMLVLRHYITRQYWRSIIGRREE